MGELLHNPVSSTPVCIPRGCDMHAFLSNCEASDLCGLTVTSILRSEFLEWIFKTLKKIDILSVSPRIFVM